MIESYSPQQNCKSWPNAQGWE